ncbi:MAG: demethoxyubiquinone hydroxylase family protein [Pseudomonadota bacterium]|nr:demethoxyubiquinone hydroxylase family protein [Pseudomonadota bacterium]
MRVAAAPFQADKSPSWLIADLRSDHAGELGAVMIYTGILAVSRDRAVREFAQEHLHTEQQHLELMESVLPPSLRSKAQLPWRAAGWLIGALPSLIGKHWVYATIEAVETFVDEHYGQQIDRLKFEESNDALRKMLEACRADEIAHMRDAAARRRGTPSLAMTLWLKTVRWGSKAAVVVARKL